MRFLRLLAWLLVLALVLSIVLGFLGEWRLPEYPGVLLPRIPLHELSYKCLRDNYTITLDPWDLFTQYTITIRGGEVVVEPSGPRTLVEAERVLSQYFDPELYYYYYAVLAGAASYTFDCYRVYYMHPLPLSERDEENLTRINVSLCVSRSMLVPLIEPLILAPVSVVMVNTTIYDPCTGEEVNTTTPLNIITYAPTATLNLTLNSTTTGLTTIIGYVNGEVGFELIGEEATWPWCFYYEPVNKTICYVDVYKTYNITYTYTFGYTVNSTLIADTYTYSLEYTVRDYGLETLNETCREEGYFRDIGPLGKACITIYKSGYTETFENETHIVYTSHYYLDEAWIEKWVRGFRLPREVEFTVVQNSVNALSGVWSTMEIVSRHSRLRLNETGVLFTTNVSIPGIWGIIEPVDLSDTVSICGGLGGGVKCVNITRSMWFANVIVNISITPLGDWDWGTVVDAEVSSNVTVSYNYPDVGSIDTWKIREKLTPHPGAVWFEKLALRYVHDRLVEIIESTPMINYREAYLWLLAAQIPVIMRNCTVHENSITPLLSALSDGCGCEEGRVWILGNITSYSLTVNTTSVLLMWPSLSNETVVESPVVVAEISSYPKLWQLYNETMNLYLAKPVDNNYLVCYNTYENTVFCDWKRITEV